MFVSRAASKFAILIRHKRMIRVSIGTIHGMRSSIGQLKGFPLALIAEL